MPRSVNAVASRAKRNRMLKHAKGFWGKRKNVWTVAKNAVEKSWEYSYTGRKIKKRDFRSLWIQRINAAVRELGYSYSVFMNKLTKSTMSLNRKTLADIALNDNAAFKIIVEKVMA